MKNLIQGTDLKYFVSRPGFWGNKIGSIRQTTHDGDTLKAYDFGNISVRFLGIDTPEISFEIKDCCGFTNTNHPRWIDYLTDLDHNWPEIGQVLGHDLKNYLLTKIQNSPDAAGNHHEHAAAAEDELERLIESDMTDHQLTTETFEFFIPLSYEIFDSYGRLLGFVHRYDRAEQPKSYNIQMLARGRALPYFIWPNINPFRKEPSLVSAVYDSPAKFRARVNSDNSLQEARRLFQQARMDKMGVFNDQGLQPLVLEPFELRLLGRKSAPSRWFIDLAATDQYLHSPDRYIEHLPEDRLFIPEHFVALFESKGWRKQ